MKKFYLLIGIPGAGKSHWLKMKNAISDCVLDDISQLDKPFDLLDSAINDKNIENIYIADVNFLDVYVLKKAEQIIKEKLGNQSYSINYVILKATKEIAEHNVILRNDGRKVQGTIQRFCGNYTTVINYLKDKNVEIIQSQKYKRKPKP